MENQTKKPNQDIRCPQCGSRHSSQQELDGHMRDKHPNR